MLANDFFSVLKLEDSGERLTATIKLNPQHAIYAGHFPGNPVTPGVVELQLVKELLEQKYARVLGMIAMPRCKFLHILNPVEHPEPEVEIIYGTGAEAGHITVSASGRAGALVFFKFNATYR